MIVRVRTGACGCATPVRVSVRVYARVHERARMRARARARARANGRIGCPAASYRHVHVRVRSVATQQAGVTCR